MPEPRGIYPAVPTPFERDELRPDLLGALIAKLVPMGLHGFLILGSNGEAFSLNDAERDTVLRTAREAIPKDRFMLAGCGAESAKVALERVKEAAAAGADGALILTPHYLKGSFRKESLFEHFTRVADGSPIPTYLYNIPQFTGVTIDVEVVARLSQHPNIHGMKDSSGNVTYHASVAAVKDQAFDLFAGSDKVLVPSLLMGASGGILAVANVAAARCLELYELARAGSWPEAACKQAALLKVGTMVTTRFGVPGLKAALKLLGMDAGEPRLPLLPCSAAEESEIRTTFQAAGLLS